MHNMVQNDDASDDIVPILDCACDNISEVESGYTQNEIGDNHEFDHKSDSSDREKSDEQAESVVTARCDMEQQMKISDSSPQMAWCSKHHQNTLCIRMCAKNA